jgi:hypothetical protein
MERIESLIRKLNEQFQQNADPALLLGTVQLLQFELSKIKSDSQQSLGTAKVAVVLPISNVIGVAAGYEKYAPRPVEKPVQEIIETVLVDNGTLSVVQKNGQLDMVFDPMNEIPTLSPSAKRSGKRSE